MKATLIAMFVALPIAALIVAVPQTAAAEGEAEQQAAAQPGLSNPSAGVQADALEGGGEAPAPESAEPAPAASTGANNASTGQAVAEPAGDTVVPQSAEAAGEAQPPVVAAATDKAPEPIRGAFGIRLGESFEPSTVAQVLGEQKQGYRGRGGVELEGTLLRVEPSEPDARFQNYWVRTTDDGTIYAIAADYQFAVEQGKGKQNKVKQARVVRSTCKDAVKALAKELEARHGAPRGAGWDGEWFSFRDLSENSNISLRLYANRCRTGLYSIVYTDEKQLHGLPGKAVESPVADTPAEPNAPAEANMPATGSVPREIDRP